MEKYRKKTAIVIGAGVGGLNAAARLAKAGLQVTVVEKNDHTGGRCSLLHYDGYRFDQGPSLLLMPEFFEEAFHDLGTSMEAEGIKLFKCEPNYNVWSHDGQCTQLSSDLARMKTEIEKWEGKDGFSRYLRFLDEAHHHYEISCAKVLHRNYPTFISLLRLDFIRHAVDLHIIESIYNRAAKYFWTERLRRVTTFGSMYMGMSPFEAPATYNLLQYAELAQGIWYPEGGFHQVPEKLAKVAGRLGVDFRFSCPVNSVALDSNQRRATGVKLETGETLKADVVVCNADLVYAYNHLLPESNYAKRLHKKPTSCSSISFYWAMDKRIPELLAHNIFLAENYKESFDDIFKKHTLPNEPSFYVNVPSRVDATAAPAGKDCVVVLCPVGHLTDDDDPRGLKSGSKQDWDRLVSKARQEIFDVIQTRLKVSLKEHVVHEMVNTPQTWKDNFNLDKGGILGLSHSFFNVLSFRPHTRHDSIQDLYFVGASTHPGTGVPVVLAGGKVTSEQILEDYGIEKPWQDWQTLTQPKKYSELDEMKDSWSLLMRFAFASVLLLGILMVILYVGR